MLKKIRDLGCTNLLPEETNYLNGGACKDRMVELTGEKFLDSGWVLKDYSDPVVMTCIQKVVKLRPGYAEVAHYTIGRCCEAMLGIETVFCLRRREGSEWATVITHIAGECPILKYRDWDGREE